MKKISILRALSLGLFLLAVVCGVILADWVGTLSSFGIGSIAQICPVGALETIFASGSPALSVLILSWRICCACGGVRTIFLRLALSRSVFKKNLRSRTKDRDVLF